LETKGPSVRSAMKGDERFALEVSVWPREDPFSRANDEARPRRNAGTETIAEAVPRTERLGGRDGGNMD
jgi:hypothetical protein